jgi:ABC-type transport system substrate-binding protein
MPETAPLRASDPEQLGSYRLTGRVGEGGQGTVYLGESTEGKRVAVKLLHAQFSGDAKARARFAGELASAKRVAPFCTARMLDADLDGDLPYLVSEFIDGPSLREVVDGQGPRTGGVLQRLAIGTVTALTAIHEAAIVHRDFKPTNVLLATHGPRVIDFGIARALDTAGTLTSTTVGTPSYMSPEQISGQVAGPPTDVFAWACTMVYAATGSPPFGQDSIPAVMHRILNQEPALGILTGPLRDIVYTCLAKDPRQRPTAQQILLRLLSNGGVEPGTRDAPATEVLTQGAQAAAQDSGPQLAPLSGPAGPAGPHNPYNPYGQGAYGGYPPGPDTPPPGHYSQGPGTRPSEPGMTKALTGPHAGRPRHRRRPGVWAAGAAALVLLVSAGTVAAVRLTGGGGKPNDGPIPVGGTFRMALVRPMAIEPSNAFSATDLFAVENLFTGLSRVNPNGTVSHALATKVANTNCTQWRFTIKHGTTFSNGEPVDAAAFARSWNRTAAGKGGQSSLMGNIEGYDAVLVGNSTVMPGVQANGDVLTVTLTSPDCDFEKRVAAPVFVPLPSTAGAASNSAFNQRPIGNGPFTIGSYSPTSRLTLLRNDAYAFTEPKLSEVDVTFFADADQGLSGFEAGQYDWSELENDTINTAITRHSNDGELVKGGISGMTYLLPIDDRGAMKTKEARLAVSYALDRKALIDTVYNGIYPPATSLVPPDIPDALTNGCAACVHDVAKAKSLAKQAGLGPGTKVTITGSSIDSDADLKLESTVQQQLQSALGWTVEIRTLDPEAADQDQASAKADGLYPPLTWLADYPTAPSFLEPLLSSDSFVRNADGSVVGTNYARYSNPAFDGVLKAARSITDPAQRTKQVQRAQKIALDDMALIPLYVQPHYRVANTKKFANVGMDYIGFPVLTEAALR